jgi:hypothetical protein
VTYRDRLRQLTLVAVASALALTAGGIVAADLLGASDLSAEPTLEGAQTAGGAPDPVAAHATTRIERGRAIFRHDRLGSHVFFSRALKLHRAINELPPAQALALGLKVDVEALPAAVVEAIRAGEVDLQDPAVTRFLILHRAVLGVEGEVDPGGELLWEVGITCALCHSTVDDSLAPGIGRRLDGWANRDLDVGKIVAAAPNLRPFADLLGVDVPTVRAVLESWGPGKFDAHLVLDGKAFRPDGGSAAVLIPPAFGLAGVNLATYTGWGSVTYWNALVANLEMNGRGTFWDPRLADAEKFPVAAAAGFDDVRDEPDVITGVLADLHLYQLALEAPQPQLGSFDGTAAERGRQLFVTKATCARCHVPPLFTEPGWNLHTPEEIGIDSFQADRGPTGRYRTTPLRGLSTHTQGGFYHDGRFPTLRSVIDHYDAHLELGLTAAEKEDLEQYLRSL